MKRDYKKDRPVGSDGLHGPERAVLAMHDEGRTVDEILARHPEMKESFVRHTISRFSVAGGDKWREDARLGSIALAIALRRQFPQRCRGAL